MKCPLVLSLLAGIAFVSMSPSSARAEARPAGLGSPSAAADVPLIPRATLFGNPERGMAQLSPDGKRIAYLAPVDGVMNVWVGPADDFAKAKAVTADKKRGIRQFFFAYTNDHILYLQDDGGDENWRIFCVDVTSGQAKDLTPFDSIPGPDGKPMTLPTPQGQPAKMLRPTAQILSVSEKFPDAIMIGLNNRNAQFHDVYKCNIRTGELSKVYENNQWGTIAVDDDFKLRLASRFTPDGGMEYVKFSDDAKATEPFEKVGMEDSLTTGFSGFDKSGQTLYYNDSRGRDTGALFSRDMATGKSTLLAEDPRCDVGGVIADPASGLVQAVSFNYLRNEWVILDKEIQPDFDYLKTVRPGEFVIGSRTEDDSRWIVVYTSDVGPTHVYLYDRRNDGKPGAARFLYTTRPDLEKQPLARMHPVEIKSRDGLTLVSYLTLPPSTDRDNDARPDKPLPMVLFVHGGPWARDAWGFNPYAQWLSNRGYAVLQVNFRGSTGFGKKFLNAGNLEWAGKMHNDLLDAVKWSVDQKIADKSKVGIMGGSYGGYATLVGMTFTPDEFACGVDIVGPSNIVTLLNTIPPYWAPALELFKKRVGDHTSEDGRRFLESKSPLTHVDQIKKPLLIGQGANDPRVKQSEADQIVSAMEQRQIPVTYVLFPDEGHGFARPENSTAFNAITEGFLSKHLGGRFEPAGDTVEKSTGQIKAGKEHLPPLN
ncbi:MAG: S9 family peptidase [Phycisphaerales bacterium]|nr:S9 family peptidase [Phycisphaerales bacterium]